MKKLFLAIAAIVTVFTTACVKVYDNYTDLEERVSGLESRVTALEALNTTVSGINEIVNALNDKDYVTGVTEVKDDDGNVIGYTISFTKSGSVTIYNGKVGAQGPIGPIGPEGPKPNVGIQLGEDGIYYWVIDGEVVKDASGKPIPCTQAVPSFKFEDNSWYVSYDGSTWTKIGTVTGPTVEVDDTNPDYVLLTINGIAVQLPKEKPFFLNIKYSGDLGGVGVSANSTTGLEYEIQGAGEGDDITVDVLSCTAGISAKISKTSKTAGYILITTTDVVDGKIFVYADNNKGKTNIKSITLEAGVITAVADASSAPAAGGDIALTVHTNLAHSVVVPTGVDWVHVSMKTKAADGSFIDRWEVGLQTKAASDYEYIIKVDPNETTAYRYTYVSVIQDATGEVLQTFDIVQKPAEGVTDIQSISDIPDDSDVILNGPVVVAASKVGAVLSDGKSTVYMKYGTPLAVGDSLSAVVGVKKTNNDSKATYVDASSATVSGKALVIPDSGWMYIGYAENYDITQTSTSAKIQKDNEGYYFVAPMNFEVRIESPLDDLNIDSYVGKYVTVNGYISEVVVVGIDWNTFSYICDYKMIVNSIREITFKKNSDWSLSYDGKGEDTDYPEIITNTVYDGNDMYMISVVSKDDVDNSAISETVAQYGVLMACDDLQYYFTRYSSSYTKEELLGIFTYTTTASETFREFDPGIYYAFAAGVDEDGNPTGLYSYREFEIEDPYLKASYGDYLGTWSYNSGNGVQKFVVKEKEKGVSYTIELGDTKANGGVNPTAYYDSNAGAFTLEAQDLGEWDNGGETWIDQLTSVFASFGGGYYDNTDYMNGNTLIFTARMLPDGTVDIIPDSDSFGPLEGFAIMTGVKGVSEREYIQGEVFLLPATLDVYEAPSEAYTAWIGQWNLKSGNYTYPVTITQDVPNDSYTIVGMNGFSYSWMNIPNYFDTNTGELVLIGSNKYPAATGVSLGLEQNFSLCFFANVEVDNSYYYITGTYEIGRGSIAADGTAVFNPGTITLSDGDYTVAFQRVYAIGETNPEEIYTLNGESITYYPFTMTKNSASGAPAMSANKKLSGVVKAAGKSVFAKPALRKAGRGVARPERRRAQKERANLAKHF
jgi:hypothetical protein